MPESAENKEERNIPMRICLTKSEWDTLHSIAIDERLLESSTEGDVYAVIEDLIAAAVVNRKSRKRKMPKNAEEIVRWLAECTLWNEDDLLQLIERAERYVEENK